MKRKAEFPEQYEWFVQQYGVLYEESEVPMSETDIKKTKQYYWLVVFFIILYLSLGGVTYYFNQSKGITLGMLLFVLIFVVVVGGLYYSLRKTLKRGMKSITKGIVTSMEKKKQARICLSHRDYFTLSDQDYSSLNRGDIIQIEKVGTFVAFVQKVTTLGSIFKPESIDSSESY